MNSSRYELVSKISSSLLGEIYLANDRYSNASVVAKLSTIPKPTTSLEDAASEVAILEKLRDSKQRDCGHQFIIQLVEAFPVYLENSAYLCTILEHASGGDMLDKIVEMDDRKKKIVHSSHQKVCSHDGKGCQVSS